MSLRNLLAFVSVAAAFAGSSVARGEMVVDGYTASNAGVYDRYLNSPDFIGTTNHYNFSGVGQTTSVGSPLGSLAWATMISSTQFLTAAHAAPLAGAQITFTYDNNAPSVPGNAEMGTVLSTQRIGTTDLMLGTLTQPVSSSVAIYPILVLPTLADYADLPLVVVGLATGNQGQRVGFNNITDIGTIHVDAIGGEDGPAIYYDNTLGVPGEASLRSGDSGGPTFVDYNGQLALVGIHWAINLDSQGNVLGSLDTFVPALVGSLPGATLILVPEPGALVLAGLGLACGGVWIRRRRGARRDRSASGLAA